MFVWGKVSHLIPTHDITNPHQPLRIAVQYCIAPYHCLRKPYIKPLTPRHPPAWLFNKWYLTSCLIQIQATHLRIFDVSHNSIGGEIHSGFFAQVLGMTSLLLSGNQITGSLPAGLGYVIRLLGAIGLLSRPRIPLCL